MKTKIYTKVIEALEREAFEELKSPTYVRSFLRQYSDFLGLNTPEILATYKAFRPEPLKPQTVTAPIQESEKIPVSSSSSGQGIQVAVVMVVVIVAIVGLVLIGKALVSLSHHHKSAVSVRSPSEFVAKEEAVVGRPFPVISKNEPLRLEVRASNDSWIKLKTDGKLIFQGILSRGQSEKWTAEDSFEMRTGKAEMLELIVNGQSIGSPGKGVLPKVVISRKGLKVVK